MGAWRTLIREPEGISAMKALSFWKAVTLDKSNLLDEVFAVLEEHGIRYCVIGGQAVNAYVGPLVSLDLDLAVAVDQVDELCRLLIRDFGIQIFWDSIEVSANGSRARVKILTEPRYARFIEGASTREVLGLRLPVASIEDVLQGKIWDTLDLYRRTTKRKKDLLDIERLLEAYPALKSRVPQEVLDKLS